MSIPILDPSQMMLIYSFKSGVEHYQLRRRQKIVKLKDSKTMKDIPKPFNNFSFLERTYYKNDSKRPAILDPKQILNVTSRLLSGI